MEDVARSSWPGLSGPPIAVQMLEINGSIRPFLECRTILDLVSKQDA
jgi:hypothetical protein